MYNGLRLFKWHSFSFWKQLIHPHGNVLHNGLNFASISS